ncbi:MAG: hypothetical protein AAGJ97_11190, partial [Planctomycetota bacterium]
MSACVRPARVGRRVWKSHKATAAVAVAVCLAGAPGTADARSSSDPDVVAAVERGRDALLKTVRPSAAGADALAALALVKLGVRSDHPAIDGVLNAVVRTTGDGKYGPQKHHIYAAGIQMMLLQSAGRPGDGPAMQAILDYLVSAQEQHGGWFYPDQQGLGDTSISQYAALGMWAAEDAGLKVPVSAWDRLAGWQTRGEVAGGGFTYHPPAGAATSTMTLAGVGTLSLCRRYLGIARKRLPRLRPEAGPKRFGFLQPVLEDAPDEDDEQVRKVDAEIETSATSVTDAIRRGRGRFDGAVRFPTSRTWPFYELYALERAVALSGPDRWRGVDWYDSGAEFLLDRQNGGLWRSEATGSVTPTVATAFALLFLSKATHKAVGVEEAPSGPPLGSGLRAGGRGLPTDLSAVTVSGGDVVAREMTGPL